MQPPQSLEGKERGDKRGAEPPAQGDPACGPELNTYLPPVVVISLGLVGDDARSEPQVSMDVQGPQSLLVPESYADRF